MSRLKNEIKTQEIYGHKDRDRLGLKLFLARRSFDFFLQNLDFPCAFVVLLALVSIALLHEKLTEQSNSEFEMSTKEITAPVQGLWKDRPSRRARR